MGSNHLLIDDAAWDSAWTTRCVRDKAVLALGLLACVVTLPALPYAAVAGVVAIVALVGPAGVPLRTVLAALALPAGFIVTGALTTAVTLGWDGGPTLAVAPNGPALAVTLLTRGLAGTAAILVLAATTPMVDLLSALRRLRLPPALLDIASLTYRMIFLLLNSVRGITAAQTARLGYGSWKSTLHCAGTLAAAVLVRSWDRAARLDEGLRGRGFDGAMHTLEPPRRRSPRFLAATLVCLACLTVPALLTALPPGSAF